MSQSRTNISSTVKAIRSAWFCVTILLLTSCKQERYLVVVINNTDQTIDNVTMWYDTMPFKYETIQSKTKETGIFEQHRLPEQLKLSWTDHNNDEFSQTFDTFEYIPKNYDNGRVYLKYQADNQFTITFDNTEFE